MKSGAAVALLVCGCGGSAFRGASAELPEDAPRGRLAISLLPTNCRDADGRPAPTVATRVDVVRLANDNTVVLEHRGGYDALVVSNGFVEDQALVFQAVMQPSSSKEVDTLREYRLWTDGGVLRIADHWETTDLPGRGFRARFSRPILQCALRVIATGSSKSSRS